MKQSPKILDKLLDSEVKAKLLMLLHKNPRISGTLKALAKKIEEKPEDIRRDVEDLVDLGLLKEHRLYSFDQAKDREIQRSVASQLAHSAKLAIQAKVKHRERLGVDLIDDLLIDEYPSPSSVAVLGPAGTGKSLLCQQIVNAALAKGYHGIYVTLDDFPDTVRKSMSRQGIDVTSYEETGKLMFVDCYSALVGVKSTEKYSEDPLNLTAMGITISEILTKHKGLKGVFVLDSLTTIIYENGAKVSLGFLRSCVGKTRISRFDFFLNLNPEVFHHTVVASLQGIVDGVIETKRGEPTGIRYFMRILKMKARYRTGWVPYTIDPERGLLRE